MTTAKYDAQVWAKDLVVELKYDRVDTKVTTIRIDMILIGLPGFSHGLDFKLPLQREKIVDIKNFARQHGLNKEEAIAGVWEILCILKAWHQLWRELGQQILLSESALDEIETTRREFFPELLWEGPIDPDLYGDFVTISQGDEETLKDLIYSYRRYPETKPVDFEPTDQFLEGPAIAYPRPRRQ